MRTHYTFSQSLKVAVLGSWLFGGTVSLLTAVPVLTFEPDPAGLKISWDATEGRDFIPVASDTLETWTPLELSITQPEGTNRNQVLVPTNQTAQFYRLSNDEVTTRSAYVGAQTCRNCHPSKYDEWIDTGHPFKLNKVENGEPPVYFSSEEMNVTDTPPKDPAHPELDVEWSDVSYVIGGAIWKARFVDQDGYIVTGENVQYNLQTDGWVNYHVEDPRGTKPYNCGSCHTTGWVSTADGSVNQDGLPGMWGSFAATGIECEACHGPGSRHVDAPFPEKKGEIVKDTTAELCGSCHNRGGLNSTIPASGGFIRHHEQYNEMVSAGHAGQDCVTCHNPHKSVKVGARDGIIADCIDCHNDTDPAAGTIAWDFTENFHADEGIADCVDCHMPRASKSAVAVNKYTGDIRTHIFKINPAADGEMFAPDGTANGSTGVTLGYVCYTCHEDDEGIGDSAGVGAPQLSLSELASEATNYHRLPAD